MIGEYWMADFNGGRIRLGRVQVKKITPKQAILVTHSRFSAFRTNVGADEVHAEREQAVEAIRERVLEYAKKQREAAERAEGFLLLAATTSGEIE